MKIIFSLVALCISFSAVAFAADSEYKVVSDILSPNVITLDRDITVYHYFTIKSPKREFALDAQPFKAYFNQGIVNHWTQIIADEYVPAVVGAGIYAATDPVVSKEYGNTLLEITIKKGTRILVGVDVSLSRGQAEVLDLARWMPNGLDRMSFTFSLFPTSYRDSYLKFMADNKIAAMAYDWKSGAFRVCHFTEKEVQAQFEDTPAFVVAGIPHTLADGLAGKNIDTSMFEVKGLTDQPGALSGEKKAEYEKVERLSRYLSGKTLNPSLKVAKPSLQEIAELKSQIFNCQENSLERPIFVRAPKDATP